MKDELYIDEIDAYSEYGVYLAENAYNDIVCFPPIKPIAYNDWHEKDGIDPYLDSIEKDAQRITIPFHQVGTYEDYVKFIEYLTLYPCEFYFKKIGHTLWLRFESCGQLKSTGNLMSYSLTFVDDFPMEEYERENPSSSMTPKGDYFFGLRDVAEYGIRVLQGTMDSIKQMPEIKENLKIDPAGFSGIEYDYGPHTFKSKTAKINCLMKASSIEEFWRNRNALVDMLTDSGYPKFKVTELDKEIDYFYKGCSVKSFHIDAGSVWFEFTLELEFYKGVI